jgi:hypothetical protein
VRQREKRNNIKKKILPIRNQIKKQKEKERVKDKGKTN